MSYRTDLSAEDGTGGSMDPSVTLLQRHIMETLELQAHVDRARQSIDAANARSIRTLLEGLDGELDTCWALLHSRMAALLSGSPGPQPPELESESYWQLYRLDVGDCPSHLEALLSGYAHYARQTSECIDLVRRLGDHETARVLRSVASAADNALWLIELYMEGLALHMDLGHLPEFTPAIGLVMSRRQIL